MSDIYTEKGKDVALDALRERCALLLAECTPEQQAFFLRIYPCGLEKMDQNKLCNAIDQCQRTIKKNAARAAAETV